MLGVLDEARSSDTFTPDTSEPVRPGTDAPLLVSFAAGKRSREEEYAKRLLHAARAERDAAERVAAASPSSTTFAALAQTHAALDDRAAALSAARQALALSLVPRTDSSDGPALSDPIAARMAVEIMLRFDAAREALDALSSVPLPRSLLLTAASLAVELNDLDEAMDLLRATDGTLIESFKGFVLAAQQQYNKAIPHLRKALREFPDDVDAAINLAVSLWGLGARHKAVATALRATRTAPGRKDASLLYLHLLLETGGAIRAAEEIAALSQRDVVSDARFLVLKARTCLATADNVRALPLLEMAEGRARTEANEDLRIEVSANIATLKLAMQRKSYDETIDTLTKLLDEYPDHEAVVMSFARTARYTDEAPILRRAAKRIDAQLSPGSRAYLRHQVARLEGDEEAAASAAQDWFDCDREDPAAARAAMLALGIDLERWAEAKVIADETLRRHQPADLVTINDVSYVLAMAGHADKAIALLEPVAEKHFVLMATLGLAYLAKGNIDRGMRQYRRAAEKADRVSRDGLILMTCYQALIVRQLGLDRSEKPDTIRALALAPCPLPGNWERLPEFIRLRNLSRRLGYSWPLSL